MGHLLQQPKARHEKLVDYFDSLLMSLLEPSSIYPFKKVAFQILNDVFSVKYTRAYQRFKQKVIDLSLLFGKVEEESALKKEMANSLHEKQKKGQEDQETDQGESGVENGEHESNDALKLEIDRFFNKWTVSLDKANYKNPSESSNAWNNLFFLEGELEQVVPATIDDMEAGIFDLDCIE